MSDAILISSVEGASPGSSWTDDLYLQRGDGRRWRLFVGGPAGLADAAEYFDKKTGTYALPKEIDGVAVTGIQDGMVVGGEPDWFEDADTVEFDSLDEPGVVQWLNERELPIDAVAQAIARVFRAASKSR